MDIIIKEECEETNDDVSVWLVVVGSVLYVYFKYFLTFVLNFISWVCLVTYTTRMLLAVESYRCHASDGLWLLLFGYKQR